MIFDTDYFIETISEYFLDSIALNVQQFIIDEIEVSPGRKNTYFTEIKVSIFQEPIVVNIDSISIYDRFERDYPVNVSFSDIEEGVKNYLELKIA